METKPATRSEILADLIYLQAEMLGRQPAGWPGEERINRAIDFLEALKEPSDYPQEAAGQVLAFVDMARSMSPPRHLSGREALTAFADFLGAAARDIFGAATWDGLCRATAPAAALQGVRRPERPTEGEAS